MATRLLIIHRQLNFAVIIKQALEQTGGFAVHPFTKAEAAFDFLRDHPQDIALVDFKLPGRAGPRIVQQLRALQPDIAVVVSPRLSDTDMHNLNVQGTIDMPFTARDLIPVLMNMLDIPLTERLVSNLPDEPINPMGGQLTTKSLGEEKRTRHKQMGTTQNLGDGREDAVQNRPETNILPPEPTLPKPDTKPLNDAAPLPKRQIDRIQTKKLPDLPKLATKPFVEGVPLDPMKSGRDPLGTRNLQNESPQPPAKPFVEDESVKSRGKQDLQTRDLSGASEREPQRGTRKLPDVPQVSESDFLKTRQLNQQSEPVLDVAKTRDLSMSSDRSNDPGRTRELGDTNPAAIPAAPPEFSSLDQVLQSFGFDPPSDDLDTPSVPAKDSDALRQFLATTGSSADAETFDDVLDSIDPTSFEAPKQQRQVDFEGLVKSMQSNKPEQRLPDRQQQLMDFILTSGMDSVLQEIEKTKTGIMPKISSPERNERPVAPLTLPEEKSESSSFQKLAQEEPPMPTLEESGTVSDLLVGISDSNFRDVLELLKDYDDVDLSKKKTPQMLPRVAENEFVDDFVVSDDNPAAVAPLLPSEGLSNRNSYDFDFADEFDSEASVAQVVLNTTEKNTTAPGEFSLDQLLNDINDRLTSHQLSLRPLPSWEIDTTAFHAIVTDSAPPSKQKSPKNKKKLVIEEPSFLPEDFSTGEIVPPELPPLDASEVWTTRASEASQEEIDIFSQDAETMAEPDYIEETLPTNPVTVSIDVDDVFSTFPDAEINPADEYPETEISWDLSEQVSTATTSDDISAAYDWETTLPISEEPDRIDNSAFPNGSADATPDAPAIFITNEVIDETGFEASDDVLPSANWDEISTPSADIQQVPVSAPAITSEEAYLAQLALNLTQVSLELSAEGTILTRSNEIVAVAGHLSPEDAQELRDEIHDDWGTGGQGARLRFINLPSSGKDYMLYTTATDTDLTLSMIFAGSTPLRIIRQQGQRLAKALTSAPDTQVAAMPPPISSRSPVLQDEMSPHHAPQPVRETREPHSYLWLVRDPNRRLNKIVVQSITAGLTTQLQEMQWQVGTLQVREDYVYLLAEVPDDKPSNAVIRDLKQRSAEIAFRQDNNLTPQMLWADSYLILSPGRELAPEEIQEFIDFQRMM